MQQPAPQVRYASSKAQVSLNNAGTQQYPAAAPQVVQIGGGGYSLQGGGGGYPASGHSTSYSQPYGQQATPANYYQQQPQQGGRSMSGTQPAYQQQPQQASFTAPQYSQPSAQASQSGARIIVTPQQSQQSSSMVVQAKPSGAATGRPSYPEQVTVSADHGQNQHYAQAAPQQQMYRQQAQPATYAQPQYQQAQPSYEAAAPAAQNYYQQAPGAGNSYEAAAPAPKPAPVQQQYSSHQQMASTVAAHSNMRRSAAGGGDGGPSGEHFDPPRFLMPLEPQINVREGDPVSFTTKVAPFGDSTLSVEWFKNGSPLCAGSRINTTFQRGFAILDILYTFAEDSGNYYCVAKSRSGMDQSSSSYLHVEPEAAVVHETQLPDGEMVQNLAAMEMAMYYSQRTNERYDADPAGGRPPQFLKPLAPQQVNVRENGPVHLETRVAPAGDPNLVVDWFKNGMPLSMGCRFNVILDRGFAILDIQYAYPEDSGQYFCIAKNAYGQAESNVVIVSCLEGANIITQSALPPESVQFLQNMDAPGDASARYNDFRYQEQEEPDSPPNFDIYPESQTVPENGPARFLMKISGHPRPEVIWLQNDEQLTVSSQYRIYNDGAINYLEFYRCGDIGRSQIRVIATNPNGQVYADAELLVIPANDFRPELRHIVPENPFKRMVALKKVDTTPELDNAFKKPKAHVNQLVKYQKDTEMQTRNFKPDVEEAENLYLTVQSRLRQSATRASGNSMTQSQTEDDQSFFQEAQELQRKLQQQQQLRMQQFQQQKQNQQPPQAQTQQVQQQQAPQQQQHSEMLFQVNQPAPSATNFQPQSFTIPTQQPQQQMVRPAVALQQQVRPQQQPQQQQVRPVAPPPVTVRPTMPQQQPQVRPAPPPVQPQPQPQPQRQPVPPQQPQQQPQRQPVPQQQQPQRQPVPPQQPQPQRAPAPQMQQQAPRAPVPPPQMAPPQEVMIQAAPAQQFQHQEHQPTQHHHAISQAPQNQAKISVPHVTECSKDSCAHDAVAGEVVHPQPAPHIEEEFIAPLKKASRTEAGWAHVEGVEANGAPEEEPLEQPQIEAQQEAQPLLLLDHDIQLEFHDDAPAGENIEEDVIAPAKAPPRTESAWMPSATDDQVTEAQTTAVEEHIEYGVDETEAAFTINLEH